MGYYQRKDAGSHMPGKRYSGAHRSSHSKGLQTEYYFASESLLDLLVMEWEQGHEDAVVPASMDRPDATAAAEIANVKVAAAAENSAGASAVAVNIVEMVRLDVRLMRDVS